MAKLKFLKKLLTTASAVAVLAGGVQSAAATTRTTTATPVNLSVGSAVSLNGALANGNNILLGGAHDLVTAGPITLGAGAGGVFGIDTALNTNQTFTVNNVVTWGATQDLVGIALVVNAGGSITIKDATTKLVTVAGGTITMRDALLGATITSGTVTAMRDVNGADLAISGGTITAMNDILGGRNLVASGGVITTMRHNTGNATLTNNALVTQTGNTAGNLSVAGSALYTGGDASDIGGNVTIATTNPGMNTIRDVAAAHDVTVNRGNLTMRNVGQDITVNGAAGAAAAIVTGNVGRNVVLANAGKVTIKGNVNGTLNGAGTAIFDGPGTVTGVVGGGGAVTKIVIDTVGTRTFSAAWTAAGELNFAQNGTANLTGAADLGGTNITTDTAGEGTINVNNNQTLTGNIGEIANFKVTGVRNFNINTANFATSVVANAANQVTVNVGGAASGIKNLGTRAAPLVAANFTVSAEVNNVYAADTNVAAGVTQKFKGTVSGTRLALADGTSRAFFGDESTVDAVIRGTVAGAGDVEFEGSTTVLKDIGINGNGVNVVRFSNNDQSTANLGTDNIFGGSTELRKGAIKLDKNIILNTDTTVASTPLILGDKKLTVIPTKTLSFSGDNTVKVDVVVNGDTVTSGQIISQGVLEFDAATTFDIKLNEDNNSRPIAGKTRSFTLISSAQRPLANSLNVNNVEVIGTNPLTKWTATIDDATGGLALTQEDNAKQVILGLLGTSADVADKNNFKELAAASQGTDGAKVMDLIATLTDSSGKLMKDKVKEVGDRLPALTTVSDAIETTSGAVSMGLSQRMTNLAGSQGTPVQSRTVASGDAAMSGIAAGDEGARFGAWVSPFFGKTTQKERKGAAGYKSDSYGASFGFDTRANEDMIIGAAVTVANNEMKHKNFKSGDKTKINSMMFSVYGMQQITDSWFAHGVATFGSNDVKNSEKRVATATTYDIVSGKYNSMSFNGEAMFGYNFLTEQVTLTPMAGLRYSRVNDGGYKETGSTQGQNLDVNTKASNKLEIVAGARVAGGTFDMNGMTVTPEIHGFVNHDIIGKNPKQTLGLAGTNGLQAKSNKPVKTTFNVGLGVNVAYNMMEYGAGYDAEIATKRLGHQGTLKLRVNF